METVVVTLGGKEYPATQLTESEQCEIARIMPALKKAASDFPKSTVLLREMLEVVCASVRRTDSNVTIEEATKEWTVFAAVDLLNAVYTLLDFTVRRETSALLDGDGSPGRVQ
jgi:hypothetical protein